MINPAKTEKTEPALNDVQEQHTGQPDTTKFKKPLDDDDFDESLDDIDYENLDFDDDEDED